MTAHGIPEPAEIKNCCAAAYGQDALALLLGEHYHPGGRSLTERLADALDLRPGQRVVDVAAGRGATARLLAEQRGARVTGVELNADTVERARRAAIREGVDDLVRFEVGDGERLPLPDAAGEAVVCECAFCTFPDKRAAASEFARVLAPGGRVGITDITARTGELPEELTGLAAWIACIADARPLEEYTATLEDAGLRTVRTQRHDEALRGLIDTIEARIKLLRMTAPDRLSKAGVDADAVLHHTRVAAEATERGTLGYAMILAEKPAG